MEKNYFANIFSITSSGSTKTSSLYSSLLYTSNWFFRTYFRSFKRFIFSGCPNIKGSPIPHRTIPGFPSVHAKCWKKESTPIHIRHSLRSSESSENVKFFRKSETSCVSHSIPICTIFSRFPIDCIRSSQYG